MQNENVKLKIKRGFTLVEILLAVFVLEIGLLGIATFYAYSLQISKLARQETTASNLAAGLLDEELSQSYDNLAVSSSVCPEGAKTNYTNDTNSPFYIYQKRIDIAYIDANLTAGCTSSSSNENMKKITVTVYWMDNSQERNVQTATIKAKH